MGSDFIDRIFPGCNQAALLELAVIALSADKEMALLVAKVTVTKLSDDREPGTAVVYWVILSSDRVVCLVALPEWNLAKTSKKPSTCYQTGISLFQLELCLNESQLNRHLVLMLIRY